MMLGERSYVQPTTCPYAADDFTSFNADDYSVFFQTDSFNALHPFLPNSNDAVSENGDFVPSDAHTCDNFRMFEFKVRKCTRSRSHDWTECPYAHPGEKARRRDPRRYHYSGTSCPDFRKGSCRKGDACEFAHGVFECWLHPARYRTQPCKDGMSCRRRVCFFAHSPDQLRVLSPRADSFDGCGSPRRLPFLTSPEFPESPPADSPPMSPMTPNSVNEIVASLRRLHLNKVKSMPSPSWMGGPSSPRVNITRPGFFSLPATPTRAVIQPEIGYMEEAEAEGEAGIEWVESGRDLRAKMFEKLSKENPLDRPNPNPDLGWVSELVK